MRFWQKRVPVEPFTSKGYGCSDATALVRAELDKETLGEPARVYMETGAVVCPSATELTRLMWLDLERRICALERK